MNDFTSNNKILSNNPSSNGWGKIGDKKVLFSFAKLKSEKIYKYKDNCPDIEQFSL